MPSWPDDHGTVVMLDEQGNVIDELSYDEKWHFPFIGNREGVSLERINADGETQDAYNWHSASTDIRIRNARDDEQPVVLPGQYSGSGYPQFATDLS